MPFTPFLNSTIDCPSDRIKLGRRLPNNSRTIMPTINENAGCGFDHYASRFSHSTETAAPGYYSVMLEDSGVRAELTSTKRVGSAR